MEVTDPWTKSALPAEEVKFLKEYFRLLDAEAEEGAARAWAECWTKDGEFVQGNAVITGHDGKSVSAMLCRITKAWELTSAQVLEAERIRVWAAWPHLIHKVKVIYVDPTSPQTDVLVVAGYEINGPDGSLITRDTAAHFHLVKEDDHLKIKRFDIYAVSHIPCTQKLLLSDVADRDFFPWSGRIAVGRDHDKA